MRVALTKGSLLIPPTYFAVAHARALANEFDFRFFAGAAHIADPSALSGIALTDVLAEQAPFTDRWPVRRREQIGDLRVRALAGAIERWHPEVIHQHFAYRSSGAVRAARRTSTPLVLTVHGGDAFVPLTPAGTRSLAGRPALARMKYEITRAYDAAACLLAVSEYLAGVAVRGGADPARIRVHYQGVDTDVFTAASRERSSVPRVLFVGRLTETKGVIDLVEASLAMRAEHQLVFVGDGPARPRLGELAAAHPHISVLGSLTSAEVLAQLRDAHVLVLPTRVNGIAREAAGLVLLEAQACGVPVVAYDSGGTSEMLRDGETGWLAPEGDVAGLTDRIAQALVLNGAEWDAMSQRARRFVVEERSLTRSAAELSEIYREVAA